MASKNKVLEAKRLQLLGSSKEHPVYFHGRTMKPFLFEGDELVVQQVDPDSIEIGDIVTYWDEDKFPTRRVFKIRNDHSEFFIKGDNIFNRTFVTKPEDIIGKVVARKRAGKWITTRNLSWRWYKARSRIRLTLLNLPRMPRKIWGVVKRPSQFLAKLRQS